MTTKVERYGVDNYKLLINPGGTISLDAGTSGNVAILGNLVVYGESTSVGSTNLDIEDNIITLNKGEENAGVSLVTAGINIDRGLLSNSQILFDESKNWLDSRTYTQKSGAFTFADASGNLFGIFTNNISTKNNNDLILLGTGTGRVTVTGTNNYEKQLFSYSGQYISYSSNTSDRLVPPTDPDALVNVQSMQDYVKSFNLYNWQDRIVSPTPDGNTSIRMYSTQAGDNLNKASISLNGLEVFSFEPSSAVAKTHLTTTLSDFNLINTNASTVNAFGAATTINVGAVGGTTNLNTELKVTGNLEVLSGSSIINTTFDEGRIQNSVILLKNGALQNFIPTISDVELAELFINTFDGKLYYKRNKNSIQSIREVGLANRVSNVYYVSGESGDDTNDGTTLSEPFRTIDAALATVQSLRESQLTSEYDPVTIYVKNGMYVIDNPLVIPARVGLVGDSLRTVTVRPLNRTLDMFWVNNGCYITQLTFKDNLAPSAVVSFPTDGSAGFITQSPYVQNCTTITTTGTGMRVDGDHALGLRSMVSDAFTQYNQGGIGVHMLNRGNTQLVSIFTICCDIAFLCENGGFCSITNSNSSFGNYALKADGVSEPMYAGRVVSQVSTNEFKFDKLISKPNIGDAILFDGESTYLTVSKVASLKIDGAAIVTPDFSTEPLELTDARDTIIAESSFIKTEVIKFINREYPFFTYDEATCSRDVGLILDAIADDMAFGGNFKSIKAGRSYYRATAEAVVDSQKIETLAAVTYARDITLSMLSSPSTAYTRVNNNFNIILDILENGESVAPAINYATHTGADVNRINAKDIIIANKTFFIEEGIGFITATFPALTYDSTKCRRDIGLIIEAIAYDVMYGGNSQTSDGVRTYFSSGAMQIPTGEVQPTVDTFLYINSLMQDAIINATITSQYSTETQVLSLPAASSAEQTVVNELFNIVDDLFTNGYNAIVTIEEELEVGTVPVGIDVTFHQFSLITSSSHTFEWIGAGTNVNTALPYLGGTPIEENQVIQINGGRVYYTSTDQKGDFKIGDGLKINRAKGTVEGRVFRKSLYSTLTPYILALGEG